MPPVVFDGPGSPQTRAARLAAGLERVSGGVDRICVGSLERTSADALRADVNRQRRAAVSAARLRTGSFVGRAAEGRRSSDDGRPSIAAGGPADQPLLFPRPPDLAGAQPPPPPTAALRALLTSTRLHLLLLALPLAILAHARKWGPIPIFTLSFTSLIPLASLLSCLTEALALSLGDTLGGLLLATSGNVPELAVSISALRRGLFDVVSTSLLGSILSNMLLVLGCCHIAGSLGVRGRCARHGTLAVKAYSSMLVLACAALAVGTATAHFPHDHLRPGGALAVSRGVAVLLLFMYGAFLLFTMSTHAKPIEVEAAAAAAVSAAEAGGGGEEEDESEEGCDDDLLHLLPLTAGLAMIAVTGVVAIASELLTGTIQGVAAAGVPQRLISLIILPVAGNAVEHASSVIVAAKGKMDLAHAIALGSSLQIAVFVLPVCVVAAWAMGIPYTLELDPLLFLLLLLSVLHQQSVSADGRSDWLTGTQLVCLYVIVALPSAFMKVSVKA